MNDNGVSRTDTVKGYKWKNLESDSIFFRLLKYSLFDYGHLLLIDLAVDQINYLDKVQSIGEIQSENIALSNIFFLAVVMR